MKRFLLIPAIVLAMLTPGCLGLFGGDDNGEDTGPTTASASLGQQNVAKIEEVATGLFKNWTFPGQDSLDEVTTWLNGTVGPGGAPGYEDRNDRTGMDYNSKIVANDLTSIAPEGQPVELRIKLWYFGRAGSSADLDLYINVPGLETTFAPDSSDEYSWKVSTQEIVVDTVRVAGQPFEVGVQVSNERVVTEPLEYYLKVDASYEEGVIAPGVPYAVTVPEGANGLVLSSAKAGGEEHIRGNILIIDPDDQLVELIQYNDIALASESRLVPISKPGEYVLYAQNLTGGFIKPGLDIAVPQEVRQARQLEIVTDSAVDISSASPGLAERSYVGPSTPYQEGATATFAVEGTFPLEIIATITGEVHGMTQVKISSSKGLVVDFQKMVKYEDDSGSIGHTRDELNLETHYANLATGEYTVSAVNNGQSEIGHIIVTYKR